MRWEEILKEGIRKALESGDFHQIVVHTKEQEFDARDFAYDIAAQMNKRSFQIQFVVVPDSIRDIFPVGFLDPMNHYQ